MTNDRELIESLKQEISSLVHENEELTEQLKIANLEKENEELRRKVAMEEMVTEARSRLFKGIATMLAGAGAISILGIISLYGQLSRTLESRLLEEDTFSQIQTQVTKQAYEKIAQQVQNEVSEQLVTNFREDSEFQQELLQLFSEQILKDPEFLNQIRQNATSVANSVVERTLQEITQQDPNSTFSIATDQTLNQRRYYVVMASSTVREDLVTPQNAAIQSNLTAKICPPKEGNQRFVLLVTNTDSLEVPLEDARQLEDVAQQIEPTAYTLPTEPATGVFFNVSQCN
jgi:hypothetical protein